MPISSFQIFDKVAQESIRVAQESILVAHEPILVPLSQKNENFKLA